MIKKFKNYTNEACDTIYPHSNELDDQVTFDDKGTVTYPFIYFHGNSDKTYLTLGNDHEMHLDMSKKVDNQPDAREVCRGRVFITQQVLTFWDYPDEKSDFYKIVRHLEILLGESLSDWKVEIVNAKDDSFDPYDPKNYDYIPIYQYNGSKKQSKVAKLNHEESPLNKRQNAVDKIKGWKPKKFKYKTSGELDIIAKHRLKNMYQEKLKTFKIYESKKN